MSLNSTLRPTFRKPSDAPVQPAVLSAADAARYCGLSRITMAKLRTSGGGPAFVRLLSRRIGYLRADLDAWLATRGRFTSTAAAQEAERRGDA